MRIFLEQRSTVSLDLYADIGPILADGHGNPKENQHSVANVQRRIKTPFWLGLFFKHMNCHYIIEIALVWANEVSLWLRPVWQSHGQVPLLS